MNGYKATARTSAPGRWRDAVRTAKVLGVPAMILLGVGLLFQVRLDPPPAPGPVLAITAHEAPGVDGIVVGTDERADLRLTCPDCFPVHGRFYREGLSGAWRYIHEGSQLSPGAVDLETAAASPGSPLFRVQDGSALLLDVPSAHAVTAEDCLPGHLPPGASRYQLSRRRTLTLALRDRHGATGYLEFPAVPGFETHAGNVQFVVTESDVSVSWPSGSARVPRVGRQEDGPPWTFLSGFPAGVHGPASPPAVEAAVVAPPFSRKQQQDYIELVTETGATHLMPPPSWPLGLTIPSDISTGTRTGARVSLFSIEGGTTLAAVARPGQNVQVVLCTPRGFPAGVPWRATAHGTSGVRPGERLWLGAGRPYRMTIQRRPWGQGGEPVNAVRIEQDAAFAWPGVLAGPTTRQRLLEPGWKARIPACHPGESGAPRQYLELLAREEDPGSGDDSAGAGPRAVSFPLPGWARDALTGSRDPLLLVCRDREGVVRAHQPATSGGDPAPFRLLHDDGDGSASFAGSAAPWLRMEPGERFMLAGQVIEVLAPRPGWVVWGPLVWLIAAAFAAGLRLEVSLRALAVRAGPPSPDPGKPAAGAGDHIPAAAVRRVFGLTFALAAAGCFLSARGVLVGEAGSISLAGGAWTAGVVTLFAFPVLLASRTGLWIESRWARALHEASLGLLDTGLLLVADRLVAEWRGHVAGDRSSLLLDWRTWVLPALLIALAWLLRTWVASSFFYLARRLAARIRSSSGRLAGRASLALPVAALGAGVIAATHLERTLGFGWWSAGACLILFALSVSTARTPRWVGALLLFSAAWFASNMTTTPAGWFVLAATWASVGAAFAGRDRPRHGPVQPSDGEIRYQPPRSPARAAWVAVGIVVVLAAGWALMTLRPLLPPPARILQDGFGLLAGVSTGRLPALWPNLGHATWRPILESFLLLGLLGMAIEALTLRRGFSMRAASRPRTHRALTETGPGSERSARWAAILVAAVAWDIIVMLLVPVAAAHAGESPPLPWIGGAWQPTLVFGLVAAWTVAVGLESSVFTPSPGETMTNGALATNAARSTRLFAVACPIAVLAVAAIVAVGALSVRAGARAGDIQLPAPGAGPLATLVPSSSPTGCAGVDTPTGRRATVRVCDGESFSAGGYRFRLQVSEQQSTLELTGAALDHGVIGSDSRADIVLPYPGMAGRHLEVLAPSDPACGKSVPCLRSLVGGDRTRVQHATDAPAFRLEPGQTLTLEDGMVIWPGLVPLRVSLSFNHLVLEVPVDQARLAGDRRWLGRLLPAWVLARGATWTIRGDGSTRADLDARSSRIAQAAGPATGAGGLAERHRADALQVLIDAGLLCLRDAGDPPAVPRITWAENTLGCSRDNRLRALSQVELRVWHAWRHDLEIGRWIAGTNTALETGTAAAAAAALPFVFDWTSTVSWTNDDAPPAARQVAAGVHPRLKVSRVPSRLLGVRRFDGGRELGSRMKRSAGPEQPVALPDISMRAGTTSARLEVVRRFGPLGPGDALVLTGVSRGTSGRSSENNRGDAIETGVLDAPGRLVGAVCVAEGLPRGRIFWRPGALDANNLVPGDLPAIRGGTIPAGAVSVSRDRSWSQLIGLGRTIPAEQQDCLLFARGAAGVFVRSSSRPLAVVPPAPRERATASPDRALELPALDPRLAPASERAVPGAAQQRSDRGTSGGTTAGAATGAAATWRPLASGATVTWGDFAAILFDTGDLAATAGAQASGTTARSPRRYPFGADAGQLVGAETATRSGLEAALNAPVLEAASSGIELTIHGDLQRIVSRGLNRAMERDLSGGRRGGWTGAGSASAVLLDADTGAVLAASTWPPIDPATMAEDETGDLPVLKDPSRENLAFTRRGRVGGVYPLATMLAMARAGMFDRPRVLPDRWDPSRPSIYRCRGALQLYERVGNEVLPHRRPDTTADDRPMVSCPESHAVWPDDPAWLSAVAPRAFAQRCNVFFAISALALVDGGTGVGGSIPYFYLNTDRADLGLTDRIDATFLTTPAWDPYAVVMAYFASGDRGERFIPADPGGPPAGNRLWGTLLELGHRFRYRLETGVETQQADREWAPGHAYPTAGAPWLPALSSGVGFFYPEVPGPAALGGDRAWPDGPPPTDWLEGRFAEVPRSGSLQTVLQVASGHEVSASPLSLAVIAAPAASKDGRLVSPRIVEAVRQKPLPFSTSRQGRSPAPGRPPNDSWRPAPSPYVAQATYLSSGIETVRAGLRARWQT